MAGRAVIVDLDGTLLDTRQRHFHVYSEAVLRRGGHPGGAARYWARKRRGAPWSALLALAFGEACSPDIERRVHEDFADAIEDPAALRLDRLQAGAATALARLEQAGIEPILVTARHDAAALKQQLSNLGLSARFGQVIATGGAPKHSLLDPDLRARAGAWIGDTEDDHAGARAIGVSALLVTNGIRTPGRLAALAPDHLAASFGGAVRHHLAARPKERSG